MPDPWEEPVRDFLKRKERTPYVTFQDIYEVLDIPPVRQSSDNAKRIQQIATDCGWVQTRRRVGTSSERVRAFSPITSTSQQADERLSRASRALRRNPLHTHQQPPSLFSNCLGKGVGQVGHDATDLTVAT